MGRVDERRLAREDLPPEGGPGLVVRCALPGCARAAVLDPRALFGAKARWPAAGASARFRCACGGRRTTVSYPKRPVSKFGAIDWASLDLWYA